MFSTSTRPQLQLIYTLSFQFPVASHMFRCNATIANAASLSSIHAITHSLPPPQRLLLRLPPLNILRGRPRLLALQAIDPSVQPLQQASAGRHRQGRKGKQQHALAGAQQFEQRIRVPAVVLVAVLDPRPVREGQGSRYAHSRNRSDRPRRR